MTRLLRFVPLLLPLLALVACGGTVTTGLAPLVSPTSSAPATVAPSATPTWPASGSGQWGTPTAATPVPVASTFLGRVDNSDAFIAVLANGIEVTAYVCDSKEMVSWFSGTQQGDSVSLVDDEGQRLNAQLSMGASGLRLSRGTVRGEDGMERPFATDRASNLGKGGLYRAQVAVAPGADATKAPTVGVIVLESGEFRGAYYSWEGVTPVTDAKIGSGSLTAIVPGVGDIEAARLTAPLPSGETPKWSAPSPRAPIQTALVATFRRAF